MHCYDYFLTSTRIDDFDPSINPVCHKCGRVMLPYRTRVRMHVDDAREVIYKHQYARQWGSTCNVTTYVGLEDMIMGNDVDYRSPASKLVYADY